MKVTLFKERTLHENDSRAFLYDDEGISIANLRLYRWGNSPTWIGTKYITGYVVEACHLTKHVEGYKQIVQKISEAIEPIFQHRLTEMNFNESHDITIKIKYKEGGKVILQIWDIGRHPKEFSVGVIPNLKLPKYKLLIQKTESNQIITLRNVYEYRIMSSNVVEVLCLQDFKETLKYIKFDELEVLPIVEDSDDDAA